MIEAEGIALIEFGKERIDKRIILLDLLTEGAILDLQKREKVYCELGFPKLDDLPDDKKLERVQQVKPERVCGILFNFRFNENKTVLLGDFETFGPLRDHIPALNKGYFGMRHLAIHSAHSPVMQIKDIITWDFILN